MPEKREVMKVENKWVRSRVSLNAAEALSYARDFGYPVELAAAFVLGGWRRTASTEEELRKLFEEGENLSPIGEVTLFWRLLPCERCGEPANGEYCENTGYKDTHKPKAGSRQR
ncbi:MAG: hypothetical protein A3J09_01575 [Candidatus Zambryskibacteria bacterium RIFCSPLOWO2_02_FULL_51_21]|uniref:Carbamoyl phosphate synthase ATP-binding domain-containing protein n=1 Tax=Candidatus Zambryskibacteria bacterium RIFCSPHIGHO2_02_FULL_43_37 TaxID=1802749 RepID=A0A1G2TIQ6_9BACT|nr:MAG: hypothetical protein A2723_01575 [Candidatus Zambryskibacteria bacterium RIFCSPHIGHO2_01_FULL_52_18]OHA96501.1 MAG: hypothetical protein A3D49_01325 [Candidatus Zambryskibacteria bacterium RIFCSPHIGHO2_02_FULL_43_37]OHB07171.1 MAG: hypothetical protein A2944_01090 [Candidatus Zambryskibacteria bacterium RIFCSPLOWO2_01_FULL_52_12]OHB11235.1 MAG: hypothetical protein A3J09_01575 [Candidatus Zambryskibacteria bacterium RIFCSPLOWO2_02_FULL_51_21]